MRAFSIHMSFGLFVCLFARKGNNNNNHSLGLLLKALERPNCGLANITSITTNDACDVGTAIFAFQDYRSLRWPRNCHFRFVGKKVASSCSCCCCWQDRCFLTTTTTEREPHTSGWVLWPQLCLPQSACLAGITTTTSKDS